MKPGLYTILILIMITGTTLISCGKKYSFDNYYYGSPPDIIRQHSVTSPTSPDYLGF